jgi:beta-mannosidase
MKKRYDLSACSWQVTGFTPHQWRAAMNMELGLGTLSEIPTIPATVPGSVQNALLQNGLLPDWNMGINARQCEWVENRHWLFDAKIPAEWLAEGKTARIECQGLDYNGWVYWNAAEIATFCGTFKPHTFDVSTCKTDDKNTLKFVFDCPPRWLGQFGFTSEMKEWKTRFNYHWDWVSRLVQIGIWDKIELVVSDGEEISNLFVTTDADVQTKTGILNIGGEVIGDAGTGVKITLENGEKTIWQQEISRGAFIAGCNYADLPIELWWTNGAGAQPLYNLTVELTDAAGNVVDVISKRVGFKHVEWLPCANAPKHADPWLCVINGVPTFLQGFDWTPVRPNYADVKSIEVTSRLDTYHEMGCNVMRVWGGAVLEREDFYNYCDEIGILVWQEFPLSSSGMDNWPPEDETSIAEMSEIAVTYIRRRQHHVSLLLWCGGNELQGALDGGKQGIGKPIDMTHPMMANINKIVAAIDPTHRFTPTSSSGPRFFAVEEDFGKELHWDVHGPWGMDRMSWEDWQRYWANDDALFRSEVGCAGCSPVDIIEGYRGNLSALPGSIDNPLWRRTYWWIQWEEYKKEFGKEPDTLEEYVEWSQGRQAKALGIATTEAKKRFPGIGGIIYWMGHDSFPCTANTAVIDMHGRMKPAAEAIGKVFRTPQEDLKK